MAEIPVNIKDYIIKSRQSGLPDSKIIEGLKSSNWPEDIINMAVQEANTIIQPVFEPIETPEVKGQTELIIKDTKSAEEKPEQTNKIPIESEKPKLVQKKRFCFLTFIALIFSLIPFIGLGIAMTSLDLIKKKNMSGTIIAVLALLINIGSILFVVYIIVQLLTLNPTQLEGISKVIVERLGIL